MDCGPRRKPQGEVGRRAKGWTLVQEVHGLVREQVPSQRPLEVNAQARSGKAPGRRQKELETVASEPCTLCPRTQIQPRQLPGEEWVPRGSSDEKALERNLGAEG